jgi:hypothetical protein
MKDHIKNMTNLVDGFMTRDKAFDPYFFWEPFDLPMPSPEVILKAHDDGVDLLHDEGAQLAGPYPRQFQTGFIKSTKKIACIQASSQTGKSISNFVLLGASISRQPPYCLRYEEGEDTGIKRMVNPVNIRRYGRRDSVSGTLIDFNINAPLCPSEWDCGNITGIGKFPEELYCPEGQQIWIGTLPRSIDVYWWPGLTGTGQQRFLPLEFLDRSRANKGSDKQARVVYGPRDTMIFIKSYDSERQAFETKSCHILLWDEEPPKTELFVSGQGHAEYHRWSFTPFRGFTFTHGLFFGCVSQKARDKAEEYGTGMYAREDFDFFLASQYECPYQDENSRERNRLSFSEWERKSVIWGRYSRQTGKSFFDRNKIDSWARKFPHDFELSMFVANRQYSGVNGSPGYNIGGILDTKVSLQPAEPDNPLAWRIYEKRKPNVGYLAIFDAAEGGIDPSLAQDKAFGMIVRAPTPEDGDGHDEHPIVVATTRSTLPTIAFARAALPCLRYYNNAVLAPERGHGKDNEAFGQTLDDWPWWYYNTAGTSGRTRKGFDTHTGTRSALFEKLQEWVRNFDIDEDPCICDSWVYEEMSEAIIKETQGGKKKCDHPKSGSLDGVICLGIATYIYQQTPEVIECNDIETDEREGFMQRHFGTMQRQRGHIPMGAGVSDLGCR